MMGKVVGRAWHVCRLRRGIVIMDQVGSDDESLAGSFASTAVSLLAIVMSVKVVACKLCRAEASEASPLKSANPNDRFGGYRPWGHYSKVRNDHGECIGRKPDGKVCLLCINVFNALGLDLSL